MDLELKHYEALELVGISRIKFLKPASGAAYFLVDKKDAAKASSETYATLRDYGYIEVTPIPDDAVLPAAGLVTLTEKGHSTLLAGRSLPIDSFPEN